MKIYRPGMPVVYVDETPPKAEKVEGENPLPSVEAAIAAAHARQAQILNYTRSSPPIDPEKPTQTGQKPVSAPQPVPQEDQSAIEAQIAALQARLKPHSVNSDPEVSE